MRNLLTSLELCAGAGGQARGLELAGFDHGGLVELDADCCKTLRLNRPHWTVHEKDLNKFDGREYQGVDLLAGGLPCPPFSVAGKQLGKPHRCSLRTCSTKADFKNTSASAGAAA
jgi:DNA (cytosine-5)-methyltransferase 1